MLMIRGTIYSSQMAAFFFYLFHSFVLITRTASALRIWLYGYAAYKAANAKRMEIPVMSPE